ncbi:MAG: YqeG family HAD IIIA-type phosphatase [Acutalibacteraceae bacterium]
MNFFRPTYFVDSVADISADFLIKNDIKALILDVDDTITTHGSKKIDSKTEKWLEDLNIHKIKLILLSNNFKDRVSQIAEHIGVPYVYSGMKPLPNGFIKALDILHITKENTMVVGDQIFTDILGANIAGICSILVEPKGESQTLLLKIKRFMEKPFKKRLKKSNLKVKI